MQLKIKTTTVFKRNLASKARITVNEGGTRSSKTYSLAQIFALLLVNGDGSGDGLVLTVCRKTFPSLKATAYKDFIEILKRWGIYNEKSHNKSDHIYKYGNNQIEFISVDQPQKIRGRKRHYLWINEANELKLEDYKQLILRTTKQIYMDYNPSDMFHWIYDEVLVREDCVVIHSTYLDNPFLEEETVKEIERLEGTDKNYWRIYGLGLRGVSETTIYTHWDYCDVLPAQGEKIFGMDFGFNHPTALTEVRLNDDDVYVKEHIYKSGLVTPEIIDELNTLVENGVLTKHDYIYGDSEDAEKIEEIKRAGFNIKPAKKGAGSVKTGIDQIKRRRLFITKDSVNGTKEIKSYSWKEKDGKPLDEPVKVNDDFCDAFRYAVYSHTKKRTPGIA